VYYLLWIVFFFRETRQKYLQENVANAPNSVAASNLYVLFENKYVGPVRTGLTLFDGERMNSYRRGKEPKEQVGVVFVADRKVTGIGGDPVRPEHVRHFGQVLGPEYVPVPQVRREQQRLGDRTGRGGLGVPQRIRAPQVQRRGLGRRARGRTRHATPPRDDEYGYDTERGAHGCVHRTVLKWSVRLAAGCERSPSPSAAAAATSFSSETAVRGHRAPARSQHSGRGIYRRNSIA